MALNTLKAVIFDFNGVLVDDLEIQEEAYWRAGADLDLHVPKETVRRFISYPPQRKRSLYFGDIPDEIWRKVFERKESHYYRLARTRDLVFPDAAGVLTSLAERYTLAIISNTHRDIFDRVFPRHLARLFKDTLFADEIEQPKPSPEPFLRITARLSLGPDECCYVGDSVLDVQMARAVGVKMFAVATGNDSREELLGAGADFVSGSLKEFAGLLGHQA